MSTPEPVDHRTEPPRLASTVIGWQAWWEDHNVWDGHALYADPDTAKHHAVVDYVAEEYGWRHGDDPDDQAPDVTLAWAPDPLDDAHWHLLADGADTGVRLCLTLLYTPAVTA